MSVRSTSLNDRRTGIDIVTIGSIGSLEDVCAVVFTCMHLLAPRSCALYTYRSCRNFVFGFAFVHVPHTDISSWVTSKHNSLQKLKPSTRAYAHIPESNVFMAGKSLAIDHARHGLMSSRKAIVAKRAVHGKDRLVHWHVR
eukprot:364705-Chlamydomonas_euryale.AAC.1